VDVGVGDIGGGLECGINYDLNADLKEDFEYHSPSSFYVSDWWKMSFWRKTK
jgi:hypothetical protein